MTGCNDLQAMKFPDCFVQRPVERISGSFVKKLGEAAAVELHNPGWCFAIENEPADSKKGLESDKAKRVPSADCRMAKVETKVSGKGRPQVDSDVLLRHGKSSRVSLFMAIVAQGYGLAFVIGVKVKGVLENLVGIPVELPETEQDVVKLNDVMALKAVGFVADKAADGFVAEHPVVIAFRRAKLPFDSANRGVSIHN